MRKVIFVVLMTLGVVFSGVFHFTLAYHSRISSSDPLAFERNAYAYLAGFVGIAFFLIGGMMMALWPGTPKPPLPSPDDFPPRPPNNETL
jgi:hypothetical protein